MKLMEKLGLGLYPLKKYGFDAVYNEGKKSYEETYWVEGDVKGKSVNKVEVNISITGEDIHIKFYLYDPKCYLEMYEKKLDWRTSVEEILYQVSIVLEQLGLNLKY